MPTVAKVLNSNNVADSMTSRDEILHPRVWGYNLELDSSDDSGDDAEFIAKNHIDVHDLKPWANEELANSTVEFTEEGSSFHDTCCVRCGDCEILSAVVVAVKDRTSPCRERKRNIERPRGVNCGPASHVWGYDLESNDSSSEGCDSMDEDFVPDVKDTVKGSPQELNSQVSVTCNSEEFISSGCRIEKKMDRCDRRAGDACEGERDGRVIKSTPLPVLTLSSGKHISSIMINNCAMGTSDAAVIRKKKRHVPMFKKQSELRHIYTSPQSRDHPSTSMYRSIPPVVSKESSVGHAPELNSMIHKPIKGITQKCKNYVIDTL